jgi:hypothetical protein
VFSTQNDDQPKTGVYNAFDFLCFQQKMMINQKKKLDVCNLMSAFKIGGCFHITYKTTPTRTYSLGNAAYVHHPRPSLLAAAVML